MWNVETSRPVKGDLVEEMQGVYATHSNWSPVNPPWKITEVRSSPYAELVGYQVIEDAEPDVMVLTNLRPGKMFRVRRGLISRAIQRVLDLLR